MNHDFIKIKSLEGELKISHKKKDMGMTVSTKELVLQKPHVNYHIKLENIVSIVSFESIYAKPVTFVSHRSSGNEVTKNIGVQQYKFYVREAVMHNRSGIFQLGPMEFIMPMIAELLHAVAEHGGMSAIV
jgi:hypothetical protein